MIKKEELSANSLAFLGDALYALEVKKHIIFNGYQKTNTLTKYINYYCSAKSQALIFDLLLNEAFFNEKDLEIYKLGRNKIKHIPKNGDLKTYMCASGFEALIAYLYLNDKNKYQELITLIFKLRDIKEV